MKKAFYHKIIIISFLLVHFFNASAQKLSDLEKEYLITRSSANDTVKVNKLNALFWDFIDAVDMKNAELALKDAQAVSIGINYKKGLAQAYHCFGVWHYYNDEMAEAISYYIKSINVKEQFLNNYQASATYNNIGIVFRAQQNFSQALEYYEKSLHIDKQNNDDFGVATSYNNIGNIYVKLNKFDSALDNFNKALEIREKIKDLNGVESTLNNLGVCYEAQQQYQKALYYYTESLKIATELKNESEICIAYYNVGTAYALLKSYDLAFQNFETALKMAEKNNIRQVKRDCFYSLADLFLKKENHKKSNEFLIKFIALKDSLLQDENSEKINQLEARFQNVKKQREIDELENQKKIQTVEMANKDSLMSKQAVIRNAFILGFVLATILVFFIFRSYKQKQEANKLLSLQKIELAQKNKEITDSIKYAKHIQEAILPSKAVIESFLPQSFVFYRPKDVVSGDFYYFQPIAKNVNETSNISNQSLIFGVADCTGHGVPGAFMSIIGNQSLKEAISTFGITQPSKILDFSNNSINQTLRKRTVGGAVSDGMDIAICNLDLENKIIEFAGAIHSMFIVRELFHKPLIGINIEINPDFKNDTHYLFEVLGDKQSIGSNDNETARNFTNTKLALHKNDLIYLVSDGYVDQFGGPDGKKFKYKQLKKMLLAIANKPIDEQHNAVQNTFDTWKDTLEQVDDVCLMGIKIV